MVGLTALPLGASGGINVGYPSSESRVASLQKWPHVSADEVNICCIVVVIGGKSLMPLGATLNATSAA